MRERQDHEIVCDECGAIPDCPQVKDEVWAQIAKPDSLLCLHHAEKALGRQIVPEDLAPCPANRFTLVHAKRQQ